MCITGHVGEDLSDADRRTYARCFAGRPARELLSGFDYGTCDGRVAGWIDAGPFGEFILLQHTAEVAEVLTAVGGATTLRAYRKRGDLELVVDPCDPRYGDSWGHALPQNVLLVTP